MKIKIILFAAAAALLAPLAVTAEEADNSFQLFPRTAAELGFSYYFPNEMDYVFSLNRTVEIDIFKWNMLEMWMNFRQLLYFSETDKEAFSPFLIRYDIEYFNLALNLDGHYISIYSDHICYNTINLSRIPRGTYRTYSIGLKVQNEGLRLKNIKEGISVFENTDFFKGQLHYMAAFSTTYNPFGSERYKYKYIGLTRLKYVSTAYDTLHPFLDIGSTIFIDETIKPDRDILLGLYLDEASILNSVYYHYRFLHDIDGFNSTPASFHSIGINTHFHSDKEKSEDEDAGIYFSRLHFTGGYGKLYNHRYSNHQADMAVRIDIIDSPRFIVFFNTDLSHQSELQGRRAIGGLSPRYLLLSLGPGITYKIPETRYSFTLSHDFNRYDIGYNLNDVLERFRGVNFAFSKTDNPKKEDTSDFFINKSSWSQSVSLRYKKVEHPYDFKLSSRYDYYPFNFNTWLPVMGIGASSEIGSSNISNQLAIRTGIMKLGNTRTTFYIDNYFNSSPDPFRGENRTHMLAGLSVEI